MNVIYQWPMRRFGLITAAVFTIGYLAHLMIASPLAELDRRIGASAAVYVVEVTHVSEPGGA